MLVFNFGIIYDYVQRDELLGKAVVTSEMLALSRMLGAVVVAGIFVVTRRYRRKAILLADGDKINIFDMINGARINIGDNVFVIGDEHTNYQAYHKVILSDRQIRPNLYKCSKHKIMIFCDKFGVNLVYGGKFERIFNKYTKIILK